jgi:ribonucleoside-triphosphate reductase (thioredoxin)
MNMNKPVSVDVLSDITTYMKYSKYLREEKRRETWEELCIRNMEMHIKKYPQLKDEIEDVYTNFVIPKKVLPSMRSLQFGGRPIEVSPNRIFNCAFRQANEVSVFQDAMFLLLGGSGVGYSVQRHHVEQLPPIKGTLKKTKRYLVGDSIEGWSDAIKVLVEAYFEGKPNPIFDYSDIRPKGAELITSGGKAPGPQPLMDCIHNLRKILDTVERGEQLSTLQVHDMICFIADAVLAGGIRRAALISLFSLEDEEMMSCKSGAWWEENPQRGRANNSCVILRHKITHDEWNRVWEAIRNSGCGEPGVYFSNDKEWGTNPCCEIALRNKQFCNLTELNGDDIVDQGDFNARARAGAFLGTLQAGYTDFHYLSEGWKEATEKDSLIGVGITGIASGATLPLNLEEAANHVKEENLRVANLININPAARTTCVKPSGTSSLVLGSSSGIHAWHNDYYVRRIRVGKDEAIYQYLADNHPELVEDEKFRPTTQAVIEIPQKAPDNAIIRTESPLDLLERVARFDVEWVGGGHRDGQNNNNVSCTISIKEDEWDIVGEWQWRNRNKFNGISVLPYDGGTYVQAPFEDITEEEYRLLEGSLSSIDLTKVVEETDNTDHKQEAACAGGVCEISL